MRKQFVSFNDTRGALVVVSVEAIERICPKLNEDGKITGEYYVKTVNEYFEIPTSEARDLTLKLCGTGE